jgi:hypothetical protein
VKDATVSTFKIYLRKFLQEFKLEIVVYNKIQKAPLHTEDTTMDIHKNTRRINKVFAT